MADTPADAAPPPPEIKEEGVKRAAPGDDAPRQYPKPIKKNVSAFLHFCAEQREAIETERAAALSAAHRCPIGGAPRY